MWEGVECEHSPGVETQWIVQRCPIGIDSRRVLMVGCGRRPHGDYLVATKSRPILPWLPEPAQRVVTTLVRV